MMIQWTYKALAEHFGIEQDDAYAIAYKLFALNLATATDTGFESNFKSFKLLKIRLYISFYNLVTLDSGTVLMYVPIADYSDNARFMAYLKQHMPAYDDCIILALCEL